MIQPEKVSCCVFCRQRLAGTSNAPWDVILRDTGDYVISPSKGSLVPGWLLVIAKKHSLCAGALSDSSLEKLRDAVAIASQLVNEKFGPPTIFEHGPATTGSSLGCGIDHLHIHVVPLQFSLIGAVNSFLPNTDWKELSDFSETRELHHAGIGYAFVEEAGRRAWFRPPEGMRQMLRQVIASQLDRAGQFDYGQYPHAENALSTLDRLRHLSV